MKTRNHFWFFEPRFYWRETCVGNERKIRTTLVCQSITVILWKCCLLSSRESGRKKEKERKKSTRLLANFSFRWSRRLVLRISPSGPAAAAVAKWEEKKKKKKKKAATLGTWTVIQLWRSLPNFQRRREEKRKKERREIILNFFRSQQTGFCLEGLRVVGRTWNDSFLVPCFFFLFRLSRDIASTFYTHTYIFIKTYVTLLLLYARLGIVLLYTGIVLYSTCEREREMSGRDGNRENKKREHGSSAPGVFVKGNGLAEREREKGIVTHTHSLIVYYRSNNKRYRCPFVSRDCSGV